MNTTFHPVNVSLPSYSPTFKGYEMKITGGCLAHPVVLFNAEQAQEIARMITDENPLLVVKIVLTPHSVDGVELYSIEDNETDTYIYEIEESVKIEPRIFNYEQASDGQILERYYFVRDVIDSVKAGSTKEQNWTLPFYENEMRGLLSEIDYRSL